MMNWNTDNGWLFIFSGDQVLLRGISFVNEKRQWWKHVNLGHCQGYATRNNIFASFVGDFSSLSSGNIKAKDIMAEYGSIKPENLIILKYGKKFSILCSNIPPLANNLYLTGRIPEEEMNRLLNLNEWAQQKFKPQERFKTLDGFDNDQGGFGFYHMFNDAKDDHTKK